MSTTVNRRKSETTNAVIWSLVDTYAGFVLKFVFAVAIIRILTPHDYGLIAYMGLFLGIASFLSEGGFGTALIQKTNATDIDYGTAFIFNIGVSAIFFIIYFLIAGFIAGYFNEPALKSIMRVSSLNLVLNSFCYVHIFKLIKSLEFKKQAIVNFTASTLSGIIGLTIALVYKNYWALIFQTLSGTFIRMVGYWIATKYFVLFKFSWTSFTEQIRFGSVIFFQGLSTSIVGEIQSLVIGKKYLTASLGNYSRGQKLYDLCIVQTGLAINKVLYPTMAKHKNDPHNHRNMYVKYYSLLFFIMAPLTLFLLLLSDAIIEVLLTSKWIMVVPYFRLYCLGGFIFMLSFFNSTALLSANKPKLYITLDILQKLLTIIAVITTFRVSISAIIIGGVAANYISYLCLEIIMFKQQYYDSSKYRNIIIVLICMVPSIIIFHFTNLFISDSLFLLIINLFLQPITYLLTMRLFDFKIYKDFSALINPFLPKSLARIISI